MVRHDINLSIGYFRQIFGKVKARKGQIKADSLISFHKRVYKTEKSTSDNNNFQNVSPASSGEFQERLKKVNKTECFQR